MEWDEEDFEAMHSFKLGVDIISPKVLKEEPAPVGAETTKAAAAASAVQKKAETDAQKKLEEEEAAARKRRLAEEEKERKRRLAEEEKKEKQKRTEDAKKGDTDRKIQLRKENDERILRQREDAAALRKAEAAASEEEKRKAALRKAEAAAAEQRVTRSKQAEAAASSLAADLAKGQREVVVGMADKIKGTVTDLLENIGAGLAAGAKEMNDNADWKMLNGKNIDQLLKILKQKRTRDTRKPNLIAEILKKPELLKIARTQGEFAVGMIAEEVSGDEESDDEEEEDNKSESDEEEEEEEDKKSESDDDEEEEEEEDKSDDEEKEKDDKDNQDFNQKEEVQYFENEPILGDFFSMLRVSLEELRADHHMGSGEENQSDRADQSLQELLDTMAQVFGEDKVMIFNQVMISEEKRSIEQRQSVIDQIILFLDNVDAFAKKNNVPTEDLVNRIMVEEDWSTLLLLKKQSAP
jgi:hypothetical protein